MIIIEKIFVNDIPLLHIVKKDNYDQKLPYLQFIHGFTSAKEHNLHFAYNLAEKGFRVVLPDCLYHGERETGLSKMDLNMRFWDIVLKTMDEIPIIKESFEEKGLIDANHVGLVGTSMGGIVTLGALRKYSWIHAAVSLMGMPYYEKFANFTINEVEKRGYKIPLKKEEINVLIQRLAQLDLSKDPEKLNNRPLLFWHSKQDNVVPYEYSYQFYEAIKPLYDKTPENLCFISDETSGHKVSRLAMLKTVDWFEKHLQ
ncbi:prolyl oligopeptidase family serine peptidase [Niallia sp. 03133]|uniref:prolyl oligopeptidase family serine peptidase n=1 Tax=Niallia sp. 03133 TaxID=3458060 RepID=UPI0040445DE2